MRSIEDIFASGIRTPALAVYPEPEATTGIVGLPSVLLQEIGSRLSPPAFHASSLTCKTLWNELAGTAPGLKAARADGEVSLYPWQASNVRKLVAFLQNRFSARIAGEVDLESYSEGMVLCDAPGGGKTVSVLSTIVRTMRPRVYSGERAGRTQSGHVCIVFAPKVIVPQWASQIVHHFHADVSGLHLFADAKQLHLYEGLELAPLSEAEIASRLRRDQESSVAKACGGVYVEQRPSAALPDANVLATFDLVLLPKEMLSLRTDLNGASQKEKNDVHIRQLKPHARLVVVDESHNMSSHGTISNQLLNVEAFAGVPKLLVSGTPGTSPRRLYDMLALIKHESWRSGGGYARWSKTRFTSGTGGLVLAEAEASVTAELTSCFLHTPAEVIFAQSAPERLTKLICPSEVEEIAYNYVLSLHQRDVLRAGPAKTKPAEWSRTAGAGKHRLSGSSVAGAKSAAEVRLSKGAPHPRTLSFAPSLGLSLSCPHPSPTGKPDERRFCREDNRRSYVCSQRRRALGGQPTQEGRAEARAETGAPKAPAPPHRHRARRRRREGHTAAQVQRVRDRRTLLLGPGSPPPSPPPLPSPPLFFTPCTLTSTSRRALPRVHTGAGAAFAALWV